MVSFRIYGAVHDPNTFFVEELTRRIAALIDDSIVDMNVLFEADYLTKLEELKVQGYPELLHHKETHVILRDKELIGDMKKLISIATQQYGIEDPEMCNSVIHNRNVREMSFEMMRQKSNPIVIMRYGVQDQRRPKDFDDLGLLHIELYADCCPKAAENFKRLCEGVSSPGNYQYNNCPVHRLVKNGWLQSGDVVDGSGRNSVAVYDDSGVVQDESFTLDFGFPHGGIVGYANEGPHSNRSQFFITLGPCPWMNHKFVGVGRVLQGYEVLKRLNEIPTSNQVPTRLVKITECGLNPVK